MRHLSLSSWVPWYGVDVAQRRDDGRWVDDFVVENRRDAHWIKSQPEETVRVVQSHGSYSPIVFGGPPQQQWAVRVMTGETIVSLFFDSERRAIAAARSVFAAANKPIVEVRDERGDPVERWHYPNHEASPLN